MMEEINGFVILKTITELETMKAGYALGSILKKGDVVCLEGDIGVGKTVFVKGMAASLDVKEYVTSPTFTIVNEYNGKFPVYHFDVYRISDLEEMSEIGFEEYIYGDGVTIVEWADLIREILPGECIWIKLERDSSENGDMRIISIDFRGEKYHRSREEFISTVKRTSGNVVDL